jgi:HPt (histidine-containing phosphotransfer) domain-containing protein
MSSRIHVQIPSELLDIAPRYLQNRIHDLSLLKDALTRKDWPFILKLSHQTKGTAGGYGFTELGNLAKSLETAAKVANLSQATIALDDMRNYLENVEIKS